VSDEGGKNVSVCVCGHRCPGSEVAMQALTGRKVDLAFRIYQALLGAAAGGGASQPMDAAMQVSTAYNRVLYCFKVVTCCNANSVCC